MINLAVINLKDIIKFLRKLVIIIFLIIILYFILKKSVIKSINNNFSNISHKIFEDTILISEYNNNNKLELKKRAGIKRLLETEISMFSIEELMEKENLEEINKLSDISLENYENDIITVEEIEKNNINETTQEEQSLTKPVQNISNHIDGNIIYINNKKDTFTNVYNGVKIKNESSYLLTDEMMIPNVDLENRKDIIIYHTHTCESYTPTQENNYIASGNFRTIDLNFSVSRVGDELTKYLLSFGFNVIHNKNYHDYPAYSGSYSRALITINEIKKQNPNSELIIDLHRDALSNSEYGPTVKLGDETVSQLMFVIGTDGGGLEHPNWLYNFKLAIKIQEKANEMYPGLFKPIILRNSRYNQHVSKGAFIIEVGATGNTLEQCNESMKYFAKVIDEVMK